MHQDWTKRTIETYDAIAAAYADRWYDQRLETALRRFRQQLADGARVLDAGCGHGRDTHHLRELGLNAIGLDRSLNLLREAQRRGAAPWCLGDLRQLPFANDVFHGVWACASLLHLPKEEMPLALRELQRVMIQDGTLWLAVKAGTDTEMVADWAGHERFFAYYDQNELARLVRDAGFVIRKIKIVNKAAQTHNWINLTARASQL